MKTTILGIGNSLLRDEGVGVHVLKALRASLPENDSLSFVDGGTLSFTLAAEIEQTDRLIVIDAAQLHEPPGTVRCFVDAEMDAFLGSCKRSVHEVGLLDLFERQKQLLGIELLRTPAKLRTLQLMQRKRRCAPTLSRAT